MTHDLFKYSGVSDRMLLIRSMLLTTVCCLLALQSASHCQAAGDEESPNPALGKEAIATMLASRAALTSGKVVISSSRTYRNGAQKLNESIEVLFDQSMDKLRYTYQRDNRVVQYSRNPAESLLHVLGSHVVSRAVPDKKWEVADADPVDPRCIGITTFRGAPQERFEELAKIVSGHSIDRFVVEAPNRWRLESLFNRDDASHVRKTLWVDPECGFAAVKAEMALEKLVDGNVESRTLWEEHAIQNSEIEGVWLPVRWRVTQHNLGASLDWQIQWSMVNQEVPSKEFEIEGLNLPVRTQIVDKARSQ